MRLIEALTLRVKDIDLDRREVVVRRGKGSRDRAEGKRGASLPDAFHGKSSLAVIGVRWQWVFPARRA